MKLKIKVIPRSSINKMEKLSDGSYKVKLKAPPVEGEANKELIKFLSKEFGVAKSRVRILKGEKGRSKMVEIDQ